MLDVVQTGYDFVEYRAKHKDQVLALESELWGTDPGTTESYFEWKYECNPQSDRPILYVALSDCRVVGVRGFAGSKWQAGRSGRVYPALLTNDFVVSRDHRGKGVGTSLMMHSQHDLAGKDHDFMISFSAFAATQSMQLKKSGWHYVAPYRPLRYQTTRAAMLGWTDRRLRSGLAKLPLLWRCADSELFSALGRKGGLAESAGRYPAGSTVGGKGRILIEDDARPAEMAELVERIGNDGRITRVRDHKFFQWRFENPRYRYRILYWLDDRLEGFLVLSAHGTRQQGMISIVDWEATREEVAKDLIDAAVACAEADSLTVWSVSRSAAEKTILHKFGFRFIDDSRGHKGYEPGFSVVSLDPKSSPQYFTAVDRDALNAADWNLHMAFTDCA